MPVGPVRSQPETRELLRLAMREIAEVAVALGVAVPADAVTRALRIADSLPPEGTSSLQRDLAAGVPSELDDWSGAAVRLGAGAGVPTPVQSFIHSVLLPGEIEARRRVGRGRRKE